MNSLPCGVVLMFDAAAVSAWIEGLKDRLCWFPQLVSVDGVLQPVRCKNRRRSVCPPCSAVYRNDWLNIAYSGMFEEDGEPVEGYDFYFLTLTAPSFGEVHRLNNCPCGVSHSDEDVAAGLLGVSLDASAASAGLSQRSRYDYGAHIAWNSGHSRLWAATQKRLERAFGDDVEFFISRELQKRLSVHYHCLLRVPSSYPVELVSEVLAGLVPRPSKNHRPVETSDGLRWGTKVDLKRLGSDMRGAARYVVKVLAYSAKNITADTVPNAAAALHPARVLYETKLEKAARRAKCSRKDCSRKTCSGRAHTEFGNTGRVVYQSSGWSLTGLTRGSLQKERADYTVAKLNSEAAKKMYGEQMKAIIENNAADLKDWMRKTLKERGSSADFNVNKNDVDDMSRLRSMSKEELDEEIYALTGQYPD